MDIIDNLPSKDLFEFSRVLYDVKQLAFYAKDGVQVTYPTEEELNRPISKSTLPFQGDRNFYIHLLQDLGGVKIIYEYTRGRRERAYQWLLEPDKRRLDEIYSEIEKAITKDSVNLWPKTSDNIGVIIADLENQINEIEQESNNVQFFIKTAIYGKYIFNNQYTKSISEQLYVEEQQDVQPFLKAFDDFIKVWRPKAKDLLLQANKAGIKEEKDALFNDITQLGNLLKNHDSSNKLVSEHGLENFYNPYIEIIRKFDDGEKRKLLTSKHLNSKGEIVIFPEYKRGLDEWELFKNVRETKVWWAYYQICRLASGLLNLNIENEHLSKDRILDGFYKHELEEIARGNNRGAIYLKKEKFLKWVTRVHRYIIPRLESLEGGTQQGHVQLKKIRESEKRNNTSKTSLSKREIKSALVSVIKATKMGKKERSLLKLFAKDLEPKTIGDITQETQSKAPITLLYSVRKKLKGSDFGIRTNKGGLSRKTTYQLEYLLISKTID